MVEEILYFEELPLKFKNKILNMIYNVLICF